jgi:hypothetical protein
MIFMYQIFILFLQGLCTCVMNSDGCRAVKFDNDRLSLIVLPIILGVSAIGNAFATSRGVHQAAMRQHARHKNVV